MTDRGVMRRVPGAPWARGLLAACFLGSLTPRSARADTPTEQNNHLAPFLRAGVDARHLAMGGTGAALASDVAAGYWNPAGLAILRGASATAMATQGLNFGRRHAYAAGAWGGQNGAVAFSWINAGTDDIPRADAAGNLTGDTFTFTENAFILSAGAKAGAAAFGASAKLLTQDLGTAAPNGGDGSALGYGFDFGAQVYPTPYARLGFVLHDMFSQLGSRDAGRVNDVPAGMRVGIALSPLTGITLASDLEKIRDDSDTRFHLGGELAVPLGADLSGAFRLGVNEGRYAGGIGVTYKTVTVDYAYVIEPEAFLDENHRVSVSVDLGGERRVIREKGEADRDHDGIPDAVDKCPDDPEDFDSYEDFDGCPDLDNDGDGIPDVDDLCPDEAEDFDGVEDQDGCPDLDQDHDGIPDEKDDCPGEPETVNGYKDDDGCPDTVIAFPSARILFAPGSAALPGGAIPSLDQVVQILRDHPDLTIEIQGYTDDQGDQGMNQALSQRRADAVKAYLVKKGIDAGRLLTRGYGESRPVAPNSTEAGRAANRRIEFVPASP
jgi:outer membrane protein OmpA-like peptidoglycan-associated protein